MRLLLNLPRDVYAMALKVERCPGGLGGGRRIDAGFSWHTEHKTFVGVVGVGNLDPQVVAVDVYSTDECSPAPRAHVNSAAIERLVPPVDQTHRRLWLWRRQPNWAHRLDLLPRVLQERCRVSESNECLCKQKILKDLYELRELGPAAVTFSPYPDLVDD